MERLYAEYGELLVKLEILQNQINQVKIKINENINKKQVEFEKVEKV
jgi:hypothetical protein